MPYGDVIAARNAIAHLVGTVSDAADPPNDYRKWCIQRGVADPPNDYRKWCIQRGVAVAVAPEGDGEFESFDAAVKWLRDLQQRMTSYLPRPAPGEYTIGGNGHLTVADNTPRGSYD